MATGTLVGSGKYTYEVNEDWQQVPDGWLMPAAAVAVDSQDRVFCYNRDPNHPMMVFDRAGKYLYSWGDGMFRFPHAIVIDADDHLWLTDRNHGQIMKFTPEGELLMTIGERGFRSDTGVDPDDFSSQAYKKVTHGGDPFNLPTDIAFASSGEMFITDGYGNARVHKFSADGTHLFSWGEPGTGPGEFNMPHGVHIDKDGQVLVCDRENDRVQVFSQEGEYISTWDTKLIGPAVFYVDPDDTVYIPEHNGGLISVLTPDGKRLAQWGDPEFRSCHGIAGDSLRKLFVDKLDVDAEVADILIAEGFSSLEEVAYVPMQEMLEIEGFDDETVNELRTRARDALLTMEIAREEKVDDVSQDLRDVEGLTPELIEKLADGGIHTRDDLADLAVDELTEMTGVDEPQAKALIMKAREHWFTA